MKRFLGWVLIIVLVPISYILIINQSTIDVNEFRYLNQFKEQKKVRKSRVSFSIINTGTASAPEAFIVKGGSLFKSYRISHSAIFVKHPKGNILFDTGLGSTIDEQFEEIPSKYRFFMKYERNESALTQLEQNGYSEDSVSLIIPSHLHWDHASGLEDFTNTNILITHEEKNWAFKDFEEFNGLIKSQYDNRNLKWKTFSYRNNPYENFERSFDLYGDGSIILLPVSGHTPGSVALFLTTHTGEKYFFTGDLTWSLKGLKLPADKFSLSSDIVDHNLDPLRESMVRVHFLKKRYPELYLVPAHDYEVQRSIGFFPKFIK